VSDHDDIDDDDIDDDDIDDELDDELDDEFDDDDDIDDLIDRDPDRPVEPPLWEQWAAASAALPQGERLQKVLAIRGWGSRRVCEELIAAGRVTVNGEVAVLGRRVDPDVDKVEVDGVPIGTRPGLVYYLLNKPTGVVTTAFDPQGRPTVVDLVPNEPRVFPVGRLDVGTEGLLLLTNDGDLAQRLTHPSHGVEKEYLAEVDGGNVAQGRVRALREGIELDDGMTAPATVSQPSPGVLRITIHEGRNRQVRRMCEAIGHPVTRLVRVRIGTLQDRTLKPGEWRTLEQAELVALVEAVGSRGAPVDS
jgi:23S rRNA pseudouridine2605 synthase